MDGDTSVHVPALILDYLHKAHTKHLRYHKLADYSLLKN
jgi:hypothetical protein